MSADLRPRRLPLTVGELESLRRQVLPPPLSLPPGFTVVPVRAELPPVAVHPAVAGDLRVLAVPELAVTLRAARPGLEVTACLALSGPRGAGLLRTGDSTVELSAFAAASLPDELARVVPAALAERRAEPQEVPLEALLSGGAGWIGLEPLPSRGGRPWVRLVPVEPTDLAGWLAPLLAQAAA